MSEISSVPQLRQSFTNSLNPNATKTNTTPQKQPEFHPIAATASAFIPGTGQLAKGEIGSGLAFLGTAVGLKGFDMYWGKKLEEAGEIAPKWAAVTLGTAIIGTQILSAFNAFKPKQAE